jgi:hypothetical protein
LYCRSENVRGDDHDVIRVARQSMNRANASRVISKQECMVELTSLPLVISSEDIENVNISGAMRITTSNSNANDKTLISKYQKRDDTLEHCTLCEFFHKQNVNNNNNKSVIPHFVGMSSAPTYPVTSAYARATLIIHMPWRKPIYHMMTDNECISTFEHLMHNNTFPRSVKLAYQKEKSRYFENTKYLEPVQKQECYDNDDHEIPKEEMELIRLMTSISTNVQKSLNIVGVEYERGLTYDWSKRISEVCNYDHRHV